MIFKNRQEAGKKLADYLLSVNPRSSVILALPRGGVPVGLEISKILKCPIDVLVARKIGAPNNLEFGIGAISEGNVRIFDMLSIKELGISKKELKDAFEKEEKELLRRVKLYRKNKKPINLEGKTAILVDDGLATGITAKASIKAVKKRKPSKIIFAVPVCASDTKQQISSLVDQVVCLSSPSDFFSVGQWYKDFDQVTDAQVASLIKEAINYRRYSSQKISNGGIQGYRIT